jgi:hypothetical protein
VEPSGHRSYAAPRRHCQNVDVRTSSLARLAGITAVVVLAVAADLVVIASGTYLMGAHFTPSDLAQSGSSPGSVVLRGRILLALGLLPAVGISVTAALRCGSGRWRRMTRFALGATIAAQAVAVLAAMASAS